MASAGTGAIKAVHQHRRLVKLLGLA